MKKKLLFLAVVFAFGKLFSQDHFIINFEGNNAIPETVLVKNLTQGTELSIQGADTLHLMLKGLSVEDPMKANEDQLAIYPNPFEQSCHIEFVNSRQGKVNIQLYGITGKLLYNFSEKLPVGLQTFFLSGLPAGSYILKVQTSTGLISGKFVVTGQFKSAFSLRHTIQVPLKSTPEIHTSKNTAVATVANYGKSSIEMDFWPGDEMLFVGIVSGFDNSGIYDSPSADQTYTFKFTNLYPEGYDHCFIVPTQVVEVTNPITGKTWMDRDLGARQAATSSTDEASYGDLYQWGRFADGHQCRDSETTASLSSTDKPDHGNFIVGASYPFDWRSPQNNGLWQGNNGINNPCPKGFRLPTLAELDEERESWSENNAAGAYTSELKFPAAGVRGGNGSLMGIGSYSYYWTSNVHSNQARALFFQVSATNANMNYVNRSMGCAIRCIKDY